MIILLVGIIVGFLTSDWLWGKSEGMRGKLPNLRFKFRKKTVAIHHWPIALVFAVLWQKYFGFDFMFAIFIGSTLQGLKYKDRFEFYR